MQYSNWFMLVFGARPCELCRDRLSKSYLCAKCEFKLSEFLRSRRAASTASPTSHIQA
jgi:hypothetical protein